MAADLRLTKIQKNMIITIASSFITNTKEESESSDSEDSDQNDVYSDEEDEIMVLYAIVMVHSTRGNIIPRESINDYVERVVAGYSRQHFKKHFR